MNVQPEKNLHQDHVPELISTTILAAQNRLLRKLGKLDIRNLNISEYNQVYLQDKLNQAAPFLKIYGSLLGLSLARQASGGLFEPENFCFVDYGGGSGLLSFLAKEAGIGTVIYNDIYDVCCEDALKLSGALGLPLDHVVCGDASDLVSYAGHHSFVVDALASFDVLEHIYDVQSHFETLTRLSEEPFRIVHASGANIRNPVYVNNVRKLQVEAEWRDRDKKTGHKERDTTKAYVNIRKEMIKNYAPLLKDEEAGRLAKATRGLIRRDIERCIHEYLEKGEISYRPAHPTNTCDPYTGNWCEHLIDHDWLEKTVADAGYRVDILPGTNEFGTWPKRSIKFFLNGLIRLAGRHAMMLAPHYIVCADRN